jgi:hypothetical protein
MDAMQLEDSMLSEVSQPQKDLGYVFSLIRGRQIQNISIYTKINMVICKLNVKHICNSGTTVWNSGKEGKEKNDRVSAIS